MNLAKSGRYLKPILRNTAAWIYYMSRLYLSRHRGRAVILVYHRVLGDAEIKRCHVQPGMYVLKDVFERQIRFVLRHYTVISFAELLERWERKIWDAQKAYCVITFDDGWVDNYRYAFPILRSYGVPATIFLPTAFVGTHNWFWPEKLAYMLAMSQKSWNPPEIKEAFSTLLQQLVKLDGAATAWSGTSSRTPDVDTINLIIEKCKKLPQEQIDGLIEALARSLKLGIPDERLVISWQEVDEMSANGISFGSHSHTHRILTTMPTDEIQRELQTSQYMLLDRGVDYVPVFCYPNGNYNSDIQDLVRNCGYRAAVTTRFGYESACPEDLFGLHRIGIHNDISATIPLMALHLSGLIQKPASMEWYKVIQRLDRALDKAGVG